MNNFIQSIESKRFLQIVDELIRLRKFKRDSAFCRAVSFSAQSFSQIRKAKRDVTIELISKLFKIYKGNPVFIFSGEGDMLLTQGIDAPLYPATSINNDTSPSATEELLNSLRMENEWRKKLLEHYFKQGELNINYTKVLEEQNRELLRELGRSVKK